MRPHPARLPPAPPLVLGAGLLLWGWQTGLLPFALPMALLLESHHLTGWRLPVGDREFNAVSDISGVMFFLLIVYLFMEVGAGGIYVILSMLPFVLYLLLLMQLYSERGSLRPSALFISLRRLETDDSNVRKQELDLSLPYLLLCIISASAGNQRGPWFFVATAILIAVVLWWVRPRRYHPLLWLSVLVAVMGLAYGGQLGIRQAQRSIEFMVMQVFDKYMYRYRDPNRATTAIGSLARLKLSDRIQLRLEPEQRLAGTFLLREASYSNYGFGVWSNVDRNFQVIEPDSTPGSWSLRQQPGPDSVAISIRMRREIGIIPLPHGTTRIHDVAAIELNRNRYGAVKMEIREGWIRYRADYRRESLADAPPDDEDRFIPERYRADFARLAGEWRLPGKDPARIVQTVRENFQQDYHYTLDRGTSYPRSRYLQDFLFDSKEGHCEYFATATVLLLRAAGIPARYAVGYAVDEYNKLEGQYIARDRDSHSWALAWVNGSWQVVDSTPPAWAPLADANASVLEPLFDLVALIKYRYSRWQTGDILEEDSTDGSYLLWLLPVLLLYLAWRLYSVRQKRARAGPGAGPEPSASAVRHAQGRDSALYELMRELERQGHPRRPGETLAVWFRRLETVLPAGNTREALGLHYRYRFDPDGMTGQTGQRLRELVSRIRSQGLALRDRHGGPDPATGGSTGP